MLCSQNITRQNIAFRLVYPIFHSYFLFAVEIIKTEHSDLEKVTIKVEPGTEEQEETEILYSEIKIELPDIKTECLENSERIHQTAGKTFS